MELDEKHLKPEELIYELEKRTFQERGLVILTVGQWRAIVEAYSSPLVERIDDSALSIYPVREVVTKKLSFHTFTRKFQAK